MKLYLCEYYYLATGMEGRPYQFIKKIKAENKEKALDLFCLEHQGKKYSDMNEEEKCWNDGCITIEEIEIV